MPTKEAHIKRIIITLSTNLPTKDRLLKFIELHCDHVLPAIQHHSTFEDILSILIEQISIPELDTILSRTGIHENHKKALSVPTEESPQDISAAQGTDSRIGAVGQNKRPVRELLNNIFISDVDLVAFCVDFFPDVEKRFGSGMSRTEKETILLKYADRNKLLTVLDREYPGSLAKLRS